MQDIKTFNPTRICAWCKLITHIGQMSCAVSHTICKPCQEAILASV